MNLGNQYQVLLALQKVAEYCNQNVAEQRDLFVESLKQRARELADITNTEVKIGGFGCFDETGWAVGEPWYDEVDRYKRQVVIIAGAVYSAEVSPVYASDMKTRLGEHLYTTSRGELGEVEIAKLQQSFKPLFDE